MPISKIKCITVKEHYGKVKLCISYEKEITLNNTLKTDKYLGIDIGVDNIVAITTDNQTNKSWIVKGGNIKSINQFYNKKLAKYKSLLEKVNSQKTSHTINKLSIKRYNMLDYEFHCISKKIINLCIENDIGNIIIGHNDGWKQNCDMGRKNNQKFV